MAKEEKPLMQDPWKIINYPLLSEKAIAKIETENKLVFVVDRKANKKQIKWAVEKALDVEVVSVRTLVNQKGKKRAWVKLDKKYPASEIATRFGML